MNPEDGTLTIEAVNIRVINIKYYIIDAEVLFSRAPFLKNNAEEFSYVKPFLQLAHPMVPASADEQELSSFVTEKVPLPENLHNQNLVVELDGGNQQKFLTFYSSLLKVTIQEQFGDLKVTHKTTGKPLAEVYVKVFSRNKNSSESFYRDGYTNINGLFEYAQTSGDKLKQVSRFAILIQSNEFGSRIKEIDPPKDESIS